MIEKIGSGLILFAAVLLPAVSAQEKKDELFRATSVSKISLDRKVVDRDAPSQNLPSAYVRPTAKVRFKRFVNSTVGPLAFGRAVAGAGISTWTNSPEEWGPHWKGFGKRVASNFGKNLIKQSITFGLDEALEVDSYYYRSTKKGFRSKVVNALLGPVSARNRSGKRVIGIPKLAGTYASNIIATEAWYPDRYSWKDGLRNGTISIGINAAFNLFKEFVWKK